MEIFSLLWTVAVLSQREEAGGGGGGGEGGSSVILYVCIRSAASFLVLVQVADSARAERAEMLRSSEMTVQIC